MKGEVELRQLSDWSDFVRGRCLRELLDQRRSGEPPSRIVTSPDKQHLLFLWNQPACQARVVAFQRLGLDGGDLERTWKPPQPPVVELLFLESLGTTVSWVLVIIWEQGRTEVWRFVPTAGWHLLQSLELCHGARARIVSICGFGDQLVWCEERPPLDAQPSPERRAFQYCICVRGIQVGEQGVQLSPLRVVLHNSPVYRVLAKPSGVFLVPTPATFPGIAKFVLIWRPEMADIIIAAPHGLCVSTKASHAGSEVDFKKLVLSYVGLLASMEYLGVHSCALSSCGELLLIMQTGTVEGVQPNGVWRPVFDFAGSILSSGEQVQIKVFGNILACLLKETLYLIDLNSRELIEKKILNTKGVHFLDSPIIEEVQLLAENGIYTLDFSDIDQGCQPEPSLVQMVFEEACKYYQRRSLSSSQLTVEKLKKGGMFQAPVALSSILCHSLDPKGKKLRALPEPYTKLLGTMQLELQNYENLEFLKSCVVQASESEVESYGEALVEQELSRLLHLDLNRENLTYLNVIFTAFPGAFWKAIQNHLQLQENGDGVLVARATPDIWKKVLGGAAPNPSKQEEGPPNGVFPFFELVCLSLLQFKPKWLPPFVELSQQYLGVSWTYKSKEGPEVGVPLYKRALAILPRCARCPVADGEMEIELLLCSQRPKAILQAMDLLIQYGRWQRVMETAEKFSLLSPLLNKEIFINLLGEFSQHRALDPYLDKLWELCPADISASDVLSIIQQNVASAELNPFPFPQDGSSQLTIALLKPLLYRLAQSQTSQNEIFGHVLQGSSFPPPPPPRHQQSLPKADSQEDLTFFQNQT
ncbi:Hermansky-Pudlak syndrome 6 protein [Python bivittatus]|uniref:Hermansky-Pudlak syndrome 6 protein n=1 Tax=Python bivittatus TaxID=176946 RepID=A0A9F5JBN0_PYTBI|nr:Hermansky-Pudlak syndrome 6 protein [Python bivittatus]